MSLGEYVLAGPEDVERFTSSAASSGSSSRRDTSNGPFTEAVIVYPREVCVADPSGLRRVFISEPAILLGLDDSQLFL